MYLVYSPNIWSFPNFGCLSIIMIKKYIFDFNFLEPVVCHCVFYVCLKRLIIGFLNFFVTGVGECYALQLWIRTIMFSSLFKVIISFSSLCAHSYQWVLNCIDWTFDSPYLLFCWKCIFYDKVWLFLPIFTLPIFFIITFKPFILDLFIFKSQMFYL